ncbi:hypothetical protein BCR44DRAFT_281187 [Catenaria anguillulae PL171]|uniref:Uncharacterized protein n=1 Tax=Catenaria anguillulae PL171 TaxID=765915 RepID=A0A1Y2HNC8_9FUNG|nr:hypothetical protein BCR44DRAFT_281187 [Catenaria anguillulae PL171]
MYVVFEQWIRRALVPRYHRMQSDKLLVMDRAPFHEVDGIKSVSVWQRIGGMSSSFLAAVPVSCSPLTFPLTSTSRYLLFLPPWRYPAPHD